MPDLVKVLALDGGGIRGVIPATLLAKIEEETGRRIATLFDLIAGTSTGGILALALTKPAADSNHPAYRAEELVELYARDGARIFSRSLLHRLLALDNLLDEKYPAAGLEETLGTYFGECMLSEALTEVLVTSYDLEQRQPWFFARRKALANPAVNDFPMRQVARATSAAPTYFEPLRLTDEPTTAMVDGGVYANNPAVCAYVEALKLNPGADVLVVSLGTGQHTKPIHYESARSWGLANWAKPILDVVFDGVSDTVDHQLGMLLPDVDGEPRYFRFQKELTDALDAMDDTSPENIAALRREAAEIISRDSERLMQLCEILRRD